MKMTVGQSPGRSYNYLVGISMMSVLMTKLEEVRDSNTIGPCSPQMYAIILLLFSY